MSKSKSSKSLMSSTFRTRPTRIIPSSCGWLMVGVVLLSCSEYCNSQQHELKPHNNLHLPRLHAGVERDFQALMLQQERREMQQEHYDISHMNADGSGRQMNALEKAFCYDALYLADENHDNKVDGDEFVTFAQFMGPQGFLPNANVYQDLPLILQSNFIILACLCLQMPTFDGGNQIDPQCCTKDPHIDVSGTQPGDIPTAQQGQYLYQVCFLTGTSIERLLLSQGPTVVPSESPAAVLVTDKPTDKPSRKPTEKPTHEPTDEPTDKPSRKQTETPTVKPTDEPTDEPTGEPTGKPSSQPTGKRTAKPTGIPTDEPAAIPTRKPTGKPSENPTDPPTTEASESPTAEEFEPTMSPSLKPTGKPSLRPTNFFPRPILPTPPPVTTEPTGEPTKQPESPSPTEETASQEPTTGDPVDATASPTLRPTVKDDNVTSVPIVGPSEAPSDTPNTAPTTSAPDSVPTVNPTKSDTADPATEVAIVKCLIAITDGKVEDVPVSAFAPDLIKSLDTVAEEVAYWINLGERERSKRGLQKQQQGGGVLRRSLRQNQRKLMTVVTVTLPTDIDRFTEVECPSFVPSNDLCQTVTASVELNIAMDGNGTTTDLSDPTAVKDLFQEGLNAAIENGELQAALIEINPNSVVSVITGADPTLPTLSPTPSTSDTETETSAPTTSIDSEPVLISPGGVTAIVLAGVGGLIIGFLVIATARRRGLEAGGGNSTSVYGAPADEFLQDVEEAGLKQGDVLQAAEITNLGPGDEGDDGFGKAGKFETLSLTSAQPAQSPLVVDTTKDAGIGALAATAAVGTAAAIATNSSSSENVAKKKKTSNTLYEVPGAKGMGSGSDEASSAGESGWSSNQDASSANTSIDNSLDSISQSNFAGISPVVLVSADTAGRHSETVDVASSSAASPARSQPSAEQEQRSFVSQGLSPMNSLSPVNSLSPQSQARSQEDNSYAGTEGSIHSTYSELDDAIQKGDWAAVGVTAALLASQAYADDSTQGSSKHSSARLRKQKVPLNPERAAELDHLVETGDWEGVVEAAAKFDAQEALRGDAQSSQNSESGSAVSSTAGSNTSSVLSGSMGGSSIGTAPSNMSGSHTIDTTTSPSTYTATGLTATSDTASTRSKARKLNEIRDEVEALVVAVVPEEADNVDEMMTQFRGREEELVETLRSMQERQVAQKARKESQKQAKRQAKEYVQDKKKQDSFEAVDNTGNTADAVWMKEIETSDSTEVDTGVGERGVALETPMEVDEEEEAKVMKNQLRVAIDNEDWENVAEAAAGLSGHAFVQDEISSPDNESQTSNRSVELNDLVDKGDWDGVVAAASKYADASIHSSSKDDIVDDSTIEQRRKRREERLKEEEEALAQAEIWDAIAVQTKGDDNQKEGASGNAGAAKMAADWAIDQSLAALQKAEEQGENESQNSDQKEKDDDDNESL